MPNVMLLRSLCATAFVGVLLAAASARAASFSSIVDKYGKTWISISGPIELYDYRRFKQFILTLYWL